MIDKEAAQLHDYAISNIVPHFTSRKRKEALNSKYLYYYIIIYIYRLFMRTVLFIYEDSSELSYVGKLSAFTVSPQQLVTIC